MKKFLLIAVTMAMISWTGVCQQRAYKTYSGSYSLPNSGIGGATATYTYYEAENGDYVKDGKFSLSIKLSITNKVGTTSSLTTKISGTYKDGLMDGLWNWNVSGVDMPDNAGVCTTQTKQMTGYFKAGLPNGQWNYVASPQKKREILIASRFPITYKFGNPYTSNTLAGSCKIAFENGYATGIVESNCMGNVKGQYKAPNCPVGQWKCEAVNGQITEVEFLNGYLTKMIKRRETNIYARSEYPEDVIEVTKKIATGEMNPDSLDGYVIREYGMKTIYDVDLLLNDASFYRKDLTGDLSATYGGIYGKYKQVLKIKYQDWSAIVQQSENAWTLRNATYSGKIRFYEEYLNSMYISPEDKEKIRQLIAECKKETDREGEKKALIKGIRDSIALCDRYCETPQGDLPSLPYNVQNDDVKFVYNLFKANIKSLETRRIDAYEGLKSRSLRMDNKDYIGLNTYEAILVDCQKIRPFVHGVLSLGQVAPARECLSKLVELEAQYTNANTSTAAAFGLGSGTKVEGILPYLHTAFGHLNQKQADIKEYINLINNACRINGNDKTILKKFKAVRKSPAAIIELIKSHQE